MQILVLKAQEDNSLMRASLSKTLKVAGTDLIDRSIPSELIELFYRVPRNLNG